MVVWGPLCFLTAWLTARNSVWRVPVQSLVSVGHLVSCGLYFVSVLVVAEEEYSRPEAVYFWGYFVGLNAVWIVVPAGEFVLCF